MCSDCKQEKYVRTKWFLRGICIFSPVPICKDCAEKTATEFRGAQRNRDANILPMEPFRVTVDGSSEELKSSEIAREFVKQQYGG
jgi:hypothetical protein